MRRYKLRDQWYGQVLHGCSDDNEWRVDSRNTGAADRRMINDAGE